MYFGQKGIQEKKMGKRHLVKETEALLLFAFSSASIHPAVTVTTIHVIAAKITTLWLSGGRYNPSQSLAIPNRL